MSSPLIPNEQFNTLSKENKKKKFLSDEFGKLHINHSGLEFAAFLCGGCFKITKRNSDFVTVPPSCLNQPAGRFRPS